MAHGVEVEQTKKAKATQLLFEAGYDHGDGQANRTLKFKAASWSRALATANLQLLPGERLFALELAE
jgi:hypothetical protein